MKRWIPVLGIGFMSCLLLAGCQSDGAGFSNSDGTFFLSANGTFSQTLPQESVQSDDERDDDWRNSADRRGPRDRRGNRTRKSDPLEEGSHTGFWRLISPSDGFGHGEYQVELSHVRQRSAFSVSDNGTLVVPVSSIRGFEKLLGKQKPKDAEKGAINRALAKPSHATR